MTITLDLPPQTEQWLEEEAAESHLSKEELALQLIALSMPTPQFQNGAEMVAYWKNIGLVGMWADREDMKDSTDWVRRQRERTDEKAHAKMGALK